MKISLVLFSLFFCHFSSANMGIESKDCSQSLVDKVDQIVIQQLIIKKNAKKVQVLECSIQCTDYENKNENLCFPHAKASYQVCSGSQCSQKVFSGYVSLILHDIAPDHIYQSRL